MENGRQIRRSDEINHYSPEIFSDGLGFELFNQKANLLRPFIRGKILSNRIHYKRGLELI